jgi:glucose/arabinose dehydrogenase
MRSAGCGVLLSLLVLPWQPALWQAGTAKCVAAEIRVEHFEPVPIRITLKELPPPYQTPSATRPPRVLPPPDDALLRVPAGFHVNLFARVPSARWLTLTPDGDVLCAASQQEKIVLLEDRGHRGVAERQSVFLDKSSGTNQPFGMAFTKDAFYLGNTDAVLRYPYQRSASGDGPPMRLGRPVKIASLPGKGYNQHWTRNVIVAPDGKKLYVTVGSATNADPEPPPRASVLQMNLDGSQRKVFASGLRNPVGLAFHPQTGELYATVNERDGLGDNLPPDYFARVAEGAFYGWPYAYFAPQNLDPRLLKDGRSLRPDLAARTRTPDVLFQTHSAALGLAFSSGMSFPEKYRHGAFVAFRGSWNRSRGTGYKLVFVPFDAQGRPKGWYEDFLTGFLLDPAGPTVWGRPVGLLMLPDGSLLFSEEINGRIYRVRFSG